MKNIRDGGLREGLKQTATTFIPCHDIPKGKSPPGKHFDLKNSAGVVVDCNPKFNSQYGPKDIIYDCNSHGYRSVEFSTKGDINILCIGASWTFGWAIPQKCIFHEVLGEQLANELSCSVVNWNLSQGGISNTWIARITALAVPVLKPDLTLVNFVYPNRKEFIDINGEEVRYMPVHCAGYFNCPQPYAHKHLLELTNEHNDTIDLYRNYKLVELALKDRNWIFSAITNDLEEYLNGHIDASRYVGIFEKTDRGRDGVHPGPISHKKHAEKCYKVLETLGVIPQLTR